MAPLRSGWKWVVRHNLGRNDVPLDPNDTRYPRKGWRRVLRLVARIIWSLVVGLYLYGVGFNLLALASQGNLWNWDNILQAVLLNLVIVQLKGHLWLIAPILAGFLLLGFLWYQASLDAKQERIVIELRKEQEKQRPDPFPGLSDGDRLVLKLVCEEVIASENRFIYVEYNLKKAQALGIAPADYQDSLDILATLGYIKGIRNNSGKIYHFDITAYGFERYAQVYFPGYESLKHAIAKEINAASLGLTSISLAATLNQSRFIIGCERIS